MDLIGVTRTIDHAVYMALNALAIILWRFDSALLGMSLLSYRTEDWLTGPDGGVWGLLARLIGPTGFFGLELWQACLTLALVLFGLSRILRPLLRMRSVDLGRLAFFAAMAYVFITQGAQMMRQAERWRGQAGAYVYEAVATEETINLDSLGGGDDPLYPPQDLDGQIPIRAWEAVATSYFMATSADDLHRGVPPRDFLLEYCLYDPAVPIDQQGAENAEGCSPRKAWDEWDMVTTQPITQVFGLPLPIDISLTLPIVQEHPENRQLAIRQAQEGVARLALGPLVALFPIIEANVGLMLALAASFIYLSLPIVLLFGFFLYTEPLVTRLFFQFISVFLRTLIMNGLVALFLVVLMSVAANGSLTVYLGLIGVGLVGGFFLARLAADTMKESLSQSFGAVGGVWLGATTGILGEGARRPAQAALGVAKLGATAATMGLAAGAGADVAASLVEPAYDATRAGVRDVRGTSAPQASEGARRNGRLPEPLVQFSARSGNETTMSDRSVPNYFPEPAHVLNGKIRLDSTASPRSGVGPHSAPPSSPAATPSSGGWGPVLKDSDTNWKHIPDEKRDRPSQFPGDSAAVERWAGQVYQAQAPGLGQAQIAPAGREWLGEELARHSREDREAVFRATRQAMIEALEEQGDRGAGGQESRVHQFFRPDGSLSPEGLQAVRARLDERTARSFSGQRGEHDLAVLVAAGARGEQGRNAQADITSTPLHPRTPAQTGAHFASLNRFARLSEQAGLTPEQRQRLLKEVQQGGQVSNELRREIELSLRRQPGQAARLKVDDVVASAQALPPTLRGPMAVRPPGGSVSSPPFEDQAETPTDTRQKQQSARRGGAR